MNETSFSLVKQIFLEACELQGAEQRKYLDEACGADDQLRSEVQSLLGHHSPDTITEESIETSLVEMSSSNVFEKDWIGRQLGKYGVTRVLDSGGMGIVVEAHDAAIDRRVAIKVLRSELSRDESIRQRFQAEARAAGKLNHPNVITIHDVASQGDMLYLVMEYVEGGSADDYLERHGAYPVAEAARIAAEACQGLAAAHAQGLVHRDIKPANLLIGSGGTVKVSDFGIAKLASGSTMQLTQAGQIVGTPNFMSPEQCEGQEVDRRSDVYSMGATFYSLLVGRTPYAECKSLISVINAHCTADPPDPRKLDEQIPDGCAGIIQRAMAKRPEDRYQSIEEMLADLQNYEKVQPVPPKRPAPNKLRRVLLAGIPLLLLAVGVAGWAVFSGMRDQGVTPELPGEVGFTGEPIKVGILHSLSGTMAHSEEVIVEGYKLAIEELNSQGGIRGREVVPVLYDGRSNEEDFAAGAKHLISEEGVCTIFGCCTSSSRKAVKSVVEENNHLLIYSVNTEGVETSPNIIYLGGDPTQTIIPCVRWAATHEKKQTFFLVGSDYVYPRVSNEIIKDQLVSLGGRLVGEEYLSLGSTDVRELVDKIQDAQPDAVINTISGDTQTAFRRELRRRGLVTTQFSTGIGEQELRAGDYRKEVGDYSTATYFQSVDTPENKEFVERFKKKYGDHRLTSAVVETAYVGVKLWAQALKECGVCEPGAIRASMVYHMIQAPSGLLRIDPKTQYAYRQPLIGRVEADGVFKIVWRGDVDAAPQPFPASRPKDEWLALLDKLYEGWGGRWSAP